MHEELELYVLNALEQDEHEAFERHLATCGRCQAVLPELLEVTSSLSLLADPVKPPARLKMKILAIPSVLEEQETDSTPALAPVTQLHGRKRNKTVRAVFASMAVAASFVLGGVVVTMNKSPEPAVTGAATPATQLQLIQDAPDAHMVMHKMKQGSLRIDYARSLNAGVVEAKNMPELQGESVYQLWLKHLDGTLTPAGAMGGGNQVELLPEDLNSVVAVGVTKEPQPGAQVPSSTPLAMLPL